MWLSIGGMLTVVDQNCRGLGKESRKMGKVKRGRIGARRKQDNRIMDKFKGKMKMLKTIGTVTFNHLARDNKQVPFLTKEHSTELETLLFDKDGRPEKNEHQVELMDKIDGHSEEKAGSKVLQLDGPLDTAILSQPDVQLGNNEQLSS